MRIDERRVHLSGNWAELEQHLDAALDAPANERRAIIKSRCGHDVALCEAALAWLDACEHDNGLLDGPQVADAMREALRTLRNGIGGGSAGGNTTGETNDSHNASILDSRTPLGTNARVGNWRLLREIGRGGMGAVYLAERADVELPMRAAIKFMHQIISFDAVGVRRFRDERRILAALEHPAIARLLDGGVNDGLPWFAMEYVQGAPIDQWCDARMLSVQQRILLFCRVCEGVQHAHARLVVHRDLKPANILISESGEPKLLDFGIAKLLADVEPSDAALTRPGSQPMTLAYAAPEQVRGDAPSTSSDIYSLGVLLHVLLSGQLPQEGVRLSTGSSNRLLRGDLDSIVARAMHVDPQRRYASAHAFAVDLRNHLEGRPVLARPDTAWYRLRKLVSRHPVGSTVGFVGAALLFGFTAVTWVQATQLRLQARALREQAVKLTDERDKATEVTSFLTGVLASADPYETGGHVPTLREVLDRGAAHAETSLQQRPEVRAHLLSAIAPAYFGLGDWNRAGELAEEAVAIRRQTYGSHHLEVGAALIYLATVRLNQDRTNEAEAQAREALSIFGSTPGATANDSASALSTLGAVLQHEGKLDDADVVLRALLATERTRKPFDAMRIAQVARNLAHVLRDKKQPLAALPLYQEAYELHKSLYGPDHPESANSAVNLGNAQFHAGNAVAAESLLRRGVNIKRRLLGIQHPDVAADQITLADVLAKLGKVGEATQLRTEAESVLKRASAKTLKR